MNELGAPHTSICFFCTLLELCITPVNIILMRLQWGDYSQA